MSAGSGSASDYEEYSDALHWAFKGNHILFSFIHLGSFRGFLLATLLTVITCAVERFLSFAFERHWEPSWVQRSRAMNALWRAGMYWVLAGLRLGYMLIAMSLHAGLILVALTTLAIGQFLIEMQIPPQAVSHARDYEFGRLDNRSPVEEMTPLYPNFELDSSIPESKQRSKTRMLQADMSAVDLGGETARVRATVYAPDSAVEWETGKGRDVARALLGSREESN